MRLPDFATGITLLIAMTFLFPASSVAQKVVQRETPEFTVEKTYMRKLGHTAPLRDFLDVPATSQEKLQRLKKEKPSYVRNFIGREKNRVVNFDSYPKGGDPIANVAVETRDPRLAITPSVNVEGIGRDLAGAGVPDQNGDVGLQYFIETVNSTWIQVFDLAGNKVAEPFRANTIWNQIGQSSRGDPIILYDQEAERWFLTEFPPSNRVLIAISDTEDPLGSWTAYEYSTPSFPDYPKYGIWEDMYVLTTNEGGPGLKFYAINRDDILNGVDTGRIQRFVAERPSVGGFIVATPVNWIGQDAPADGTKPMIMYINDDEWSTTDTDVLEIVEMTVDWEDEANSSLEAYELETTPFSSDICSAEGFGFACVPQPNGQGIDGLPYVVMNRVDYRNFGTHSSIVLNFAVDVTGEQDAGVRWMELRRPADGDWGVYQEGTVGSQDGLNRFMAGISIDSRGNIGLAYNVSSEEKFPSLRFTGRLASDPLGIMTIQENEFATGGGSVNTDRFGDYNSMGVDAQDFFWFTGEYVPTNGSWSTKVLSFKLERAQSDVGPFALIGPQNSADLESEQLEISFRNWGADAQGEFDVGYIFNKTDTVVESVSIDPLLTDSVYVHTFSEDVKFDVFGMYPVKAFSTLDSDLNRLNDTCTFYVDKLTRNDAQLLKVDGVLAAVCDTFFDVLIDLRNNGVDTLYSANVSMTINNNDPVIVIWTGELATGESEGIPLRISGLADGSNSVSFNASLPNDVEDEETSNDTISLEFDVTPQSERVILTLLTDEFPDETSWELRDDIGNVLYSAGPFSTSDASKELIFELCLKAEQCYAFVLMDSFGDGITAYGVDGDYQITHESGTILSMLDNPDFGSESVDTFCVEEGGCTLSALASVAHESSPGASNGLVSLFAANGIGPYQYSKDGGLQFQSSPVFTGLLPGEYVFVVEDALGCHVTYEVRILACGIQIMYNVTQATGVDQSDGIVEILTEGGSGALQYSLDGGENFQSSPVFENLAAGIYDVVVKDSVNCEVDDTVGVDFASSITQTTQGELIRVFPNPSPGDFNFEIEGLQQELFVDFQVFDASGRVVMNRSAGNFSGVIKGYFSLNNEPSGIYFLRIRHDEVNRLIRVIKQ